MAKKGSIVIMILILMTALVAIIHSLLRTTSYLTLLVEDRKKTATMAESPYFQRYFFRVY